MACMKRLRKFKGSPYPDIACSPSVMKLSSVCVANLLFSVVVFSVSTVLCDGAPKARSPRKQNPLAEAGVDDPSGQM